ncbi:unnamed protein product [Penicillium salamii]|uniref:Uncharacterized protein n=1 Tax=Penicillium salamii TaxID=1612424 RepID=A0A9W4JKF2_9EURO|nr:unnamed protein product [Penicillium salamii]CAG8188368.1 unnamed protein product [Penicillium salamii]CAG8200334.1 unnamed protein product [Penicillium salamii]CAG8206093.1 unnamed protein product [Penicillium salamii]CAG8227822.1 unnamed protein product [Penicillium salamii]
MASKVPAHLPEDLPCKPTMKINYHVLEFHIHELTPAVPDPKTIDHCTQVQIRYLCGHSSGGEFIKCPQHMRTEDERCSSKSIRHVDGRISSHKCRGCLRSG